MRKNIFLGIVSFLVIFLLIFAFGNVLGYQKYLFLFFSITTSTTVVILFSGLLGFLIGFFAMLYSYEVKRAKEMNEQAELESFSPAAQRAEKTEPTRLEEPTKEKEQVEAAAVDEFDDDDEILG